VKKLQTDNYILQEYFFNNFQHVSSLENVNLDKILKDLQIYHSLKLTEVKFNEYSEENNSIIFDGNGYLILRIEDIKSMIAIYQKSYELITKYNLPKKCDSYEGKTLKRIVQYDSSYNAKETILLEFTDNTFYFVKETCADKDYDHEPRLSYGYFSYNYYFFKHIGNDDIAREWEDYKKEVKYYNRN
jgi:hypothetical protein